MSTCCCSLAGTAACKTCTNNPNADLSNLKVTMIWSGSNLVETILSRPLTNADRIRSMNDEELAELLRDTQCNTCAWQGNDCDYADECKAEKLEMLKQECDDNGT